MDEVVMLGQLLPPTPQQCASGSYVCQPPRVTYSIDATTFPPSEQLDCTVQVKGAVAVNGKEPYFKIQSNFISVFPRRGELISFSFFLGMWISVH